MKVDFNDCEFGTYEPHRYINYKGTNYRAIDVEVITDSEKVEKTTIASTDLLEALQKNADKDGDFDGEERYIDEYIAFYADNNEGVYYCLEQIYDEPIKGNHQPPMTKRKVPFCKGLRNTTAADDIDMLINVAKQAADYLPAEVEPTTQVPDPTRHCKYWEEIGLNDLCDMLEAKYAVEPRLPIPPENKTDF